MTQTQALFADANGAPRLGQNHGYRIDGDLAHLNVELALGTDRAAIDCGPIGCEYELERIVIPGCVQHRW